MLKKRRNSLAIVYAIASFFIVVFTVSLIGYFLFEQNPFSANILVMSIGLGVFFSLILFIWLNRQINQLLDTYLKNLYEDFAAENEVLNFNISLFDLDELEQKVKGIVTKRISEIKTLKSQDTFRKEFLGNVAHELKTPLFTVQGYISTLLDGGLSDEKVNKKYLNRANKGVDRLIYIVKDLDLLTQLETEMTELVMSDFDIVEHVRNVIELLEIRASKYNISLEFDKDYLFPIEVHADQERIQQVFTNLIVNSIKYGKKKGTTEIRFEDIGEDKIKVHIADNGLGISEEHLPRLFERFYRVDKSGSRKEGGTGLGLSIVKHIVEAHQQELQVESRFNIGSQFSFTLDKANKNADRIAEIDGK